MINIPTGLCTSSYQNTEGHFAQTKENNKLILQKGKKKITWFSLKPILEFSMQNGNKNEGANVRKREQQ